MHQDLSTASLDMPHADEKTCMQPIVHYGFIPCIVVLGMTMTEPKPTLVQLVGPM